MNICFTLSKQRGLVSNEIINVKYKLCSRVITYNKTPTANNIYNNTCIITVFEIYKFAD